MAEWLENDKTGKELEASNHGLIKVLLSAAAYRHWEKAKTASAR